MAASMYALIGFCIVLSATPVAGSSDIVSACCTFSKNEGRWVPQMNESPCECQYLHLLQRVAVDSSYSKDFYNPPWKTVANACFDPLGMENGDIHDNQLSVSYNRVPGYNKKMARLNVRAAWCSTVIDMNHWIRVDLSTATTVTGLITQGRHESNVWTKSYKIKYSSDGTNWSYVTDKYNNPKVFQGNTDSETQVTVLFPVRIRTRLIQIEPVAWARYICIRFELLGCRE